jgi:molybdopterin-binding protein
VAEEAYSVLRAVVINVRANGGTTRVELVVSDPARLVAEVSPEAMDALDLRPGMAATALVKSTSIIVQH